jgi:hypothetical protein
MLRHYLGRGKWIFREEFAQAVTDDQHWSIRSVSVLALSIAFLEALLKREWLLHQVSWARGIERQISARVHPWTSVNVLTSICGVITEAFREACHEHPRCHILTNLQCLLPFGSDKKCKLESRWRRWDDDKGVMTFRTADMKYVCCRGQITRNLILIGIFKNWEWNNPTIMTKNVPELVRTPTYSNVWNSGSVWNSGPPEKSDRSKDSRLTQDRNVR